LIKIGVTGGIGSGKTTVCKLIEALNYPVYYADDRAKWLMNNNSDCKVKITNTFGNEVYSNGKLNRIFLAQTVFTDESEIEKLNQIVHPLVAKDFNNWLKNQTSKIIFKEAALMFETDSWKALDKIILITAPLEIRIKRVLKRDSHRNKEQVLNIISKQLPEEEKRKRADYIIENIDLKNITSQLTKILNQIEG